MKCQMAPSIVESADLIVSNGIEGAIWRLPRKQSGFQVSEPSAFTRKTSTLTSRVDFFDSV